MREMVLNHASLASPDRRASVEWLKDVTVGMTALVDTGAAQAILRTCRSLRDTRCLANWSLRDVYEELRRDGARDEYLFLVRLDTKLPLLSEVNLDVANRFRGCEATALAQEDGQPLLLCAITDSIAVGFPSNPNWDSDQVTVSFDELRDDGSIEEASERIDNLTRSSHAPPICRRYSQRHLGGIQDPASLWRLKSVAFPNLVFGPDVERHLTNLPARVQTVVNRLAELNDSAAKWRERGGDAPPWTCLVTPESGQLMANPRLREARRFRSHQGQRELFEWHARFGNSGRIHLRFDAGSREVEIGYIGIHLPR